MKTSRILIASVIMAGFSFRAHAETAAVLPVSGINVPTGMLEAAQDTLRGHLAATGRYQVVVVPGPVGHDEPAPATAIDAARAAGADLAVVLHVTRLGSTAQVRLTVYPTAGHGFYTDEMSAASPDDLDRVLQRLARGLATGQRARDAGDIDTVTAAESTPLLKRSATHVFGLGLGMTVPMGTSSKEPLTGASLFWLYDAHSFLADVTLQFHAKDNQGDASVGIGAYLPLSQGDFAPYLGGGARYAHTNYGEGPGASGLELYAAVGALQGRMGSVQLRGQIELFVDTFDQSQGDTAFVGHGLAFSFGIGF